MMSWFGDMLGGLTGGLLGGIGGQGSGATTSKTGLYGPLQNAIMPSLLGLTDPQKRGQALGGFTMDPALYQQIGSILASIAQGQQLNPLDTSAGRGLVSGLTQQSNYNLGTNLADLRSRFAQGGQTSTAGSSPLLNAQANAMSGAQTGLNAVLAPQLFGAYQQNLGRQMQGLSGLSSWEMTPYSILSQLAPLFSKAKQQTAQPGIWQSGLLGAGAGLLGGL